MTALIKLTIWLRKFTILMGKVNKFTQEIEKKKYLYSTLFKNLPIVKRFKHVFLMHK